MKVSFRRLALMLFALVFGLLFSIIFFRFVSCSQDFVNTVITLFSVAAGFLVSVLVFLGDPSIFACSQSWRFLEQYRSYYTSRLARIRWLFLYYVFVIFLALILTLITNKTGKFYLLTEKAFVFFTGIGLLLEVYLPFYLRSIQIERYDFLQKTFKDTGNNGEDKFNS